MNSSFYPSAAENQIAIVETRALPGGDGALWLGKMHLDPVRTGGGIERGCGGFVSVADLHLRPRGRRETFPGDPIDVAGDQTGAVQPVARSDGHALRRRVSRDHVQWLARRNTQTASLADREMVHAGMLAESAAVIRDDLPAPLLDFAALRVEIRVHERGIVAVGHEADLVALVLLSHREMHLARQCTNLRLIHFAQRELGAGKLSLRQAEKKVSLVLAGIDGTAQLIAPGAGIARDAGVMAGCNLHRAHAVRHIQKLIELD